VPLSPSLSLFLSLSLPLSLSLSLSLSLFLLVEIGLGVIRTDRLALDDVYTRLARRNSPEVDAASNALAIVGTESFRCRGKRFKETERPRTLRNPLLGYHAET
jgi:hypothetical protein